MIKTIKIILFIIYPIWVLFLLLENDNWKGFKEDIIFHFKM